MEIKTKLARRDNYGGARRLDDIKYIVIHYTGNKGDTAKNNADYFAREVAGVSAHYFVDESEVWQSVPDDRTAWHCGTKGTYYHPKCRNRNSVGVEICMLDKLGKVRQASIDNAAELVRMLMDMYDVPVENVIRHYDVTHKNCPAPMVADAGLWKKFKESLEVETMKVYTSIKEMPGWAQPTFTKLVKLGIVAQDKQGKISVQESSLQPMVYNDRLGLIK